MRVIRSNNLKTIRAYKSSRNTNIKCFSLILKYNRKCSILVSAPTRRKLVKKSNLTFTYMGRPRTTILQHKMVYIALKIKRFSNYVQ